MTSCDQNDPTNTGPDELSQAAEWRHRARHYPPEFREAYIQFQATGDRSQLGRLAAGLLEHYVEGLSAEWIAERGGSLNLHRDLGSDSIALAEVAFAVEELFDIYMTNQDLSELTTLDDLADFIERKRA